MTIKLVLRKKKKELTAEEILAQDGQQSVDAPVLPEETAADTQPAPPKKSAKKDAPETPEPADVAEAEPAAVPEEPPPDQAVPEDANVATPAEQPAPDLGQPVADATQVPATDQPKPELGEPVAGAGGTAFDTIVGQLTEAKVEGDVNQAAAKFVLKPYKDLDVLVAKLKLSPDGSLYTDGFGNAIVKDDARKAIFALWGDDVVKAFNTALMDKHEIGWSAGKKYRVPAPPKVDVNPPVAPNAPTMPAQAGAAPAAPGGSVVAGNQAGAAPAAPTA